MNINHKLHIVTILPLVLALTAVLIVTQMQYRELSNHVVEVYRQSIIDNRKDELKNYLSIANGALKHLHQDQSVSQPQAQALVKSMLAEMRFGDNGYFFAYDFDGNSLVLPAQEWRVGKNWYDADDGNGVQFIQALISRAENGGGYLNYLFNQPSKGGEVSKKLAYAEKLGNWDWMFGTGIYIDDIDEQTQLLNKSISRHIGYTSFMVLLIGILSIIAVFIAGLFIRISEKRLANIKLRALNERIFQTQEEECKRVSRELHDGVSQTVAAARFSLETAQLKLEIGGDSTEDMNKAITLIRQIMLDIRSISHQLHPGILEDYGLGAALKELGREFSLRTGIEVKVQRLSVRKIVSTELSGALYRIAQESLTNIERHSGATEVRISLCLSPGWLTLEIADNGRGFDYLSVDSCSKPLEGIGLRNMKERLSFYNGILKVESASGKGTSLIARIPQSELRYNADTSYEGG
ncbi:cache domain-containing protein [Shewanella gelidii]|uniref:histidine kinase n=1 Tax=Shewanella gelidii TaxID=1642821 RepID=A0A917JI48_9GAMM|nr:cache domain-containing protein [Shewanella gelidii]MCL1096557.1 cache domain-containing protein [Shewanella gelidii]GGI68377.1 histidine kinase [Shewanella gelidii]